MQKKEYLAASEVNAFVAWMSAHLDDATFAHGYQPRKPGATPWACASLFDAYANYHWPHVELPEYGFSAGTGFMSNMAVLDTLQKELRAGLAAGDTDRVLTAAIAVMKWGGVINHNVPWLETWQDQLCRIIGEIRDAINAGETEHPLFARSEFRFTSGMSKVYSLVCDDFAIYDSRVAAALGRAVVLFCRETGRDRVPDLLDFPWAAAKSSANAVNPPLRNAAQNGYRFRGLVRGRPYAQWNMKASWLLSAVASHPNTQHSAFAGLDSAAQRLRAIEAALFMFGYDLVRRQNGPTGDDNLPLTQAIPDARAPNHNGAATEDGWAQCETRANGNVFEYRLAPAPEGIHVRSNDADTRVRFSDDELNSTLQALLRDFGDEPFPLANSRDGVPAGRVPNGLGTAFWKETQGRSAPLTSRLAAVLESIEVFKPYENPPVPGTYWTLNRETLNVDEKSGKVNIRPYLDSVIQGDLSE